MIPSWKTYDWLGLSGTLHYLRRGAAAYSGVRPNAARVAVNTPAGGVSSLSVSSHILHKAMGGWQITLTNICKWRHIVCFSFSQTEATTDFIPWLERCEVIWPRCVTFHLMLFVVSDLFFRVFFFFFLVVQGEITRKSSKNNLGGFKKQILASRFVVPLFGSLQTRQVFDSVHTSINVWMKCRATAWQWACGCSLEEKPIHRSRIGHSDKWSLLLQPGAFTWLFFVFAITTTRWPETQRQHTV